MARRPQHVDRDTWRAERQRVWRRRNWVLNGLMVAAIAVLLIRYCAAGPG